MRADRLLSILVFLQTRGRTTTERLSSEFEVSRRTILRDLYALRVAGFPVYTETGRYGGCYLHEDYRLPLTDLTQDELSALFTMAVPTPLVDLGLGQQAKGALLKLAAALPAARRNVEKHVRHRIHLDPRSWHPAAQLSPAPALTMLREAVSADRWVRATFRRMRDIHTTRDIAPYGLVAKETRWYVVWSDREGRLRVDRASVIVEAVLLDERFERPATFDLPVIWSAWADRQEASRRTFTVRARVDPDVIAQLVHELGQDRVMRTDIVDGGEHTVYDLCFDHFVHARSTLLALGNAAEVLHPEALRRALVDFAQQVQAVYSIE